MAGDESVVARLFVIPLVLVAGAKSKATLADIVPDIGEITALLETHGAVGATRNFGLSNALAPLQTLGRITPSQVYRWTHNFTASGVPREIEAEAIEVAPGREQVHPRFLIGAGIARRVAPSFLETAANRPDGHPLGAPGRGGHGRDSHQHELGVRRHSA